MIADTTDATLSQDIAAANGALTLVDIWATWCGPCRMYTPVLEKWDDDTGNRLYKLDADANPQTMIDHGVMSIPTVLVYKNGKLRDKLVGARPYAKLQRELAELGE